MRPQRCLRPGVARKFDQALRDGLDARLWREPKAGIGWNRVGNPLSEEPRHRHAQAEKLQNRDPVGLMSREKATQGARTQKLAKSSGVGALVDESGNFEVLGVGQIPSIGPDRAHPDVNVRAVHPFGHAKHEFKSLAPPI